MLEIYAMSADSSHRRRLMNNSSPTFSPRCSRWLRRTSLQRIVHLEASFAQKLEQLALCADETGGQSRP
jgi:hypothetical protein